MSLLRPASGLPAVWCRECARELTAYDVPGHLAAGHLLARIHAADETACLVELWDEPVCQRD